MLILTPLFLIQKIPHCLINGHLVNLNTNSYTEIVHNKEGEWRRF